MTELVEWVKNIAIFYIVASLIIHIIPGKSYLQYIKVFLGIVTIILLIKPIGELFSFEDKFQDSLQDNLNLQMEDELMRDLELVGEYQKEAVIEGYTEEIKNKIKEYIESLGIEYIDSNISIDIEENSEAYGCITGISVDVSIPFTEEEGYASTKGFYEIEIKKYLANFYNLAERNININISEGDVRWD